MQIFWAYQGATGGAREWTDELGIAHTVLVDSDRSLKMDYFIENSEDVFASNPRHFVIDREGNLAFIGVNVGPEELVEAILGEL